MLAGAQQHVDRRRPNRRVPFEMHADRRAGIDVGAVVAAFVGELHAGVQAARDFPARAAFEDALRGAREERAAVVANDRNRLELLLRRAVVVRPRAHAEAEQRAEIVLRRILGGRGGGKGDRRSDRKNTHGRFLASFPRNSHRAPLLATV